jgi:catechol 2,3-dioxygenase-like lactoylglutathione lyase family enzyme
MAVNKMISGAHAIIYSRKPEADRAFLRDILGLPHVDVGDGWLIFGLPPAELAVHPSSKNGIHEFYFICKDIDAFVAAMDNKGILCGPIQILSWGKRTQVRLPGGGKLGVYQPLHARPRAARQRESVKPRRATRKRA